MSLKFLTSIDLNGNEILNVRAQVLGADPGSPLEGQFWYRSDLEVLRVRLNSTTITLGALDSEAVADIVGAMLGGNTETGITVTYQDADNTIDFAVTDSPLLNGQNAAFYLARANHTGTQTTATLSDFNSAVDARVALIVDAAPSTLDTLNELAAALGDDPNFAATTAAALGALDTRLDAVEAAGGPVHKYSVALVGGATSEVITHNLNTRDVLVTLRNNADPWNEVLVDVEATTVNTVTLRSSANLPADYRVTVHG